MLIRWILMAASSFADAISTAISTAISATAACSLPTASTFLPDGTNNDCGSIS